MKEQNSGPEIFLSHAKEDEPFARRLEAKLKEAGIEVWVCYRKNRGGDNVPKLISEGLEKSNTLLIIWSEAAQRSSWVELEWTDFLSSGKVIIPCRLDKTPLPPFLRCKAFIDLSDFEKGVNQLFFALGFENEFVVS